MIDILLIGILLAAVGAALLYIIREKKKGTRCIGCPAAGQCSKKSCCSPEQDRENANEKKR